MGKNSDNKNKEETKENFREKAKYIFNKNFNECLKDLKINEETFCENNGIKFDNFHKSRYDTNRNIPLKTIQLMETNLGKQNSELRYWWIIREKLKKKSSLKIFLDLEPEEVILLASNIEQLFKIPEKNIIFWGYLSVLNSEGKKVLLNSIKYVFNALEINKTISNDSENIFDTKNNSIMKDWLDCMLLIEKHKKDFERWKPLAEREAVIKLFLDYLRMDKNEKLICLEFDKYDNDKSVGLSVEQTIILTITILLNRDVKYKKYL